MRDPQPRQVLKRARRIITAALAQRDPDAELLAAAELVCESQPRKPDPDIAVRSPQSPSDGLTVARWRGGHDEVSEARDAITQSQRKGHHER